MASYSRLDVSQTVRLKALDYEGSKLSQIPAEAVRNNLALKDLPGKSGHGRRGSAAAAYQRSTSQMTDRRLFRIQRGIDGCVRECLILKTTTLMSGLRVAGELDAVIFQLGQSDITVSDIGA